MMPYRNMLFRLIILGWMVLGWSAARISPAQPVAPSPQSTEQLAARMQEFLPRLDHDELAERDAAEAAIIALGPAVLDLLPDENGPGSAEVQHRLSRIRQALIQQRSAQAVAASRVTLKTDAKPLAEVLAAIQTQTGNQIEDRRGEEGGKEPITIDLVDEPFWPAMDEILDQAGLTVYPYASREALSLVAGTPGATKRLDHAQYTGLFRVEPLSVTAERDLRNTDPQSMTVRVEVSWEPRVRPILIAQPLDRLTAVDDAGDDLVLMNDVESLELPVRSGASAVELPMQFGLPSRDVKEIASLRGTFDVVIPAESEDFRFPLAAGPAEQKRGNTTIVVESVRTNNNLLEVRMRARFENAEGALESHRSWVLDNASYVIDKTGEKREYGGSESTVRTETEVGFAYLFDLPDGPEGVTFVYRAPTIIIRTSANYELTDIPLP